MYGTNCIGADSSDNEQRPLDGAKLHSEATRRHIKSAVVVVWRRMETEVRPLYL